MEFETLVLSRKSLRLLRRIEKEPVENTREWADKLSELLDNDFAELQYFEDENKTRVPMLTISEDGKRYLNYISRRQNEYWLSTVLSIIAIVISLVALLRTA